MARPLTPIQRIRREFRKPVMPVDAKFVLLPSFTAKPIVFGSLGALCRRLLKERRTGQLQLDDCKVQVRDDPPGERRNMVGVYTRLDDGSYGGFVGWAYLENARRPALQAALYALEPDPTPHAIAA